MKEKSENVKFVEWNICCHDEKWQTVISVRMPWINTRKKRSYMLKMINRIYWREINFVDHTKYD